MARRGLPGTFSFALPSPTAQPSHSRVTSPEAANEGDILREYRTGTFFRQFTLSETIDQTKIEAKLTDGVLRLQLPKVEKAKPRQITVRAGG